MNIVAPQAGQLIGSNSDVVALRAELVEVANEAALFELPVVLIGAGGAARSVLQVLRAVKDLEVIILNRTRERAEALLKAFGLRGRAVPLDVRLPPAWMVINATCLGMSGFPDLSINLDDAGRPIVVEMVYSPVETRLLQQARARGMLTIDGITLLLGQAALSFETFFRLPAPFGMEPELRELLTQ